MNDKLLMMVSTRQGGRFHVPEKVIYATLTCYLKISILFHNSMTGYLWSL